jgi:hypothetical protein
MIERIIGLYIRPRPDSSSRRVMARVAEARSRRRRGVRDGEMAYIRSGDDTEDESRAREKGKKSLWRGRAFSQVESARRHFFLTLLSLSLSLSLTLRPLDALPFCPSRHPPYLFLRDARPDPQSCDEPDSRPGKAKLCDSNRRCCVRFVNSGVFALFISPS